MLRHADPVEAEFFHELHPLDHTAKGFQASVRIIVGRRHRPFARHVRRRNVATGFEIRDFHGSPPGRILCPVTRFAQAVERMPSSRVGLTIDQSGHSLARMLFEIVLAPEAVEDLRGLRASIRAEVRAAIELHLRHEPRKASRSRIKRLRGISRPQYRLRVGEVRVFYDVSDQAVEVLAIVMKSEAKSWLAQFGSPG